MPDRRDSSDADADLDAGDTDTNIDHGGFDCSFVHENPSSTSERRMQVLRDMLGPRTAPVNASATLDSTASPMTTPSTPTPFPSTSQPPPPNNTPPTTSEQHIQAAALPNSAINEYTDNDVLLACTFPHLFLLGSSGLSVTNTMCQPFRNYLVEFADNRFARSSEIVFLLFDQFLRQSTARTVHARVYGSFNSIEEFATLLFRPDFSDTLDKVIDNPADPRHSEFVKKIDRVVHVVGSNIPYTPESRRSVVSKLYALRYYLGLPGYFITVAPGDINSPLVIRLCRLPDSPDALLHTDATFELPDYLARSRLVNTNPVAAARYYIRLVETMYSVLFDLVPVHLRKRTDLPAFVNAHGFLGRPLGYIGTTETTQRGALHHHFIVFIDGLTPEVLQTVVDDPTLLQRALAVIDSTMSASLPDEVFSWQTIEQQIPGALSGRDQAESPPSPPTSAGLGLEPNATTPSPSASPPSPVTASAPAATAGPSLQLSLPS